MIRFVIPRIKDDNEIFNNYIEKSIKNITCRVYEVVDSENEVLTINKKYNLGIEQILNDNLNDDDIIVFVHNDVLIIDPLFEDKINMVFNRKVQVGIVGVIGTTSFTNNGMWWANLPDYLHGHIIQENGEKENHLVKGSVGYFEDLVVCDGLLLAVRGKLIKEGLKFNEKFSDYNDFYDVTFQIDALLKYDYKIAVVDILVKHKSPGLGSLRPQWREVKEKVINHYKEQGLEFPLTIESITKWKENGRNI